MPHLKIRHLCCSSDIQFLGQGWYVTHAGLLRLAERRRCLGIQVARFTASVTQPSGVWVFKATVHKSRPSKGFVGYGDADPSNVSSVVHGAEMRVAETRAVNRALRKAYGIGLCFGRGTRLVARPSGADRSHQNAPPANGYNGHQNGSLASATNSAADPQAPARAGLVKAYAADYCGTPALRDASKAQIGSSSLI